MPSRVACREDGSDWSNLELLRRDQSIQQPRVECREDGSDWLNLERWVAPPSKVTGLHLGEMAFESQPRDGMDAF